VLATAGLRAGVTGGSMSIGPRLLLDTRTALIEALRPGTASP